MEGSKKRREKMVKRAREKKRKGGEIKLLLFSSFQNAGFWCKSKIFSSPYHRKKLSGHPVYQWLIESAIRYENYFMIQRFQINWLKDDENASTLSTSLIENLEWKLVNLKKCSIQSFPLTCEKSNLSVVSITKVWISCQLLFSWADECLSLFTIDGFFQNNVPEMGRSWWKKG